MVTRTETAEERRTRLLTSADMGWTYDLALALGYEPEKLNGMGRLTAESPFRIRDGKVIALEFDDDANLVEVVHDIPAGWCQHRGNLLSPRQMDELRIIPSAS